MNHANTESKSSLSFSHAFIALLIGAIGMGASPIFVRFAASEVGPFASAFWRVALALPFLYGWMLAQQKRQHVAYVKIKISKYPVLAGLAFACDLFFWHLAILNTSVANATFFATLTPIYVMAITYFFLKQTIQKSALIGILVCLLGGIVLMGKSMTVEPEHLKGDLYGLITALFFSLYFLAVGKARKEGGSAASITFVQSLTTAICLLVVALIHSLLSNVGFFPFSIVGLLALICLALVSQVLGQGLLVVSLGALPTVFTSLVIFLEVIAAAFLGWLCLGEALSIAQYVGGLLILAGVWVARPNNKPLMES